MALIFLHLHVTEVSAFVLPNIGKNPVPQSISFMASTCASLAPNQTDTSEPGSAHKTSWR
jgi:hypothetical protein